MPLFAEAADAPRVVALGQPFAVLIPDQIVMEIRRDGKIQDKLQQSMQVGDLQQVLTAGDMGHFLIGIVDDDGQVVCRGSVLSPQHDIADALNQEIGIQSVRLQSPARIAGAEREGAKRVTAAFHCPTHVQPEGMWTVLRQ